MFHTCHNMTSKIAPFTLQSTQTIGATQKLSVLFLALLHKAAKLDMMKNHETCAKRQDAKHTF